ncbi:outer membrane protein [Sedimentitalea sp. XS_ASV28]|uniref:outer membrane protein n=1 Tax=Sedimentitalea sp. XS_ASV28 TaxID=3241296 RepID=UPI0035151FB1
MFVFGGSAHAGNLAPAVDDPVVVVPVTPSQSGSTPFDGFYVGGSIGYAFGGDDRVGIRGNAPQFDIGTLSNDGGIADIHLGYRWLLANYMYGLELGLEGGSVGSDIVGAGYAASMELKNAVNLRFNMGAILAEKTLVYGFAGVAKGKFDYAVSGTGAAGPVSIQQEPSDTGYVVGLGVERTLNDQWSIRAEYQYGNFGKVELSDAAGNTTSATPDYQSIKIGVNFAF